MRFNYKELEKYFAEPLPEVAVLAKALTDHSSEVEDMIPLGDNNWDLEVKILPDRAGDAKTSLGLAREISAILPDLKLKEDWSLADEKTSRAKITFSVKNINDLLGTDLTEEKIVGLLNRVRVATIDGTALIPPHRLDLNIKEDLADEVARLYGYDQIPTRILKAEVPIKRELIFDLTNQVRAKLASDGYSEVYSYTFANKGEVAIEKPLAVDKSYLRTNLSDGLKKIIKFNLRHILFDQDEVKVFEIGSVFNDEAEEINVAIGLGCQKPNLKIEITEKKLTDFENLKNNSEELNNFINKQVNYKSVSIYPRIIRDIAVWVPEATKAETVSGLIKNLAGDLGVERPVLFDKFSKEGRKSLAFRLVFQSHDRTLSDDEVNALMNQIIDGLEKQADFDVRK